MHLSFKEAYFQYLVYIDDKLKNQTKRTLKERFENKIIPYFGNYDIYKIKEIDYMNFKNKLNKNNYSYNYKRNIHYLMTSFFDFCIK